MSVQDLFVGEPALVPDALRGYRTWQPSHDGLRSTGALYQWPQPAPHVATCLRRQMLHGLVEDHPDPAPGRQCVCGFYGWYTPADTRIVRAPVWGSVRATGRVVLGTHGFRAERVEVEAVVVEDLQRGLYEPARVEAMLRDRGFTVCRSREELLERFPPQDMSGLVDHVCGPSCDAVAQLALGGLFVHLSVSSAQMAQVVQKAFDDLQRSMAQSSDHVRTALQALAGGLDGDPDEQEPDTRTRRQRALDAVRQRSTGPARRHSSAGFTPGGRA